MDSSSTRSGFYRSPNNRRASLWPPRPTSRASCNLVPSMSAKKEAPTRSFHYSYDMKSIANKHIIKSQSASASSSSCSFKQESLCCYTSRDSSSTMSTCRRLLCDILPSLALVAVVVVMLCAPKVVKSQSEYHRYYTTYDHHAGSIVRNDDKQPSFSLSSSLYNNPHRSSDDVDNGQKDSDKASDTDTVRLIETKHSSAQEQQQQQPESMDPWSLADPIRTDMDLIRSSSSKEQPIIDSTGGLSLDVDTAVSQLRPLPLAQEATQNIIAHSIITVHTQQQKSKSSNNPETIIGGNHHRLSEYALSLAPMLTNADQPAHYHNDNIETIPTTTTTAQQPPATKVSVTNTKPLEPVSSALLVDNKSVDSTANPVARASATLALKKQHQHQHQQERVAGEEELSFGSMQPSVTAVEPNGIRYDYYPSLKHRPSSSSATVGTYDITSAAPALSSVAIGKQAVDSEIKLSASRRRNSGNKQNHHHHHRQQTAQREIQREQQPSAATLTSHLYRATAPAVSSTLNEQRPQYATRRQSSYSVSDQCALLLDRLVGDEVGSYVQGVGSSPLELSSIFRSGVRPEATSSKNQQQQAFQSYRTTYGTIAGSGPLFTTTSETLNLWSGQRRFKRHHQNHYGQRFKTQPQQQFEQVSQAKLNKATAAGSLSTKFQQGRTANSGANILLYNNNDVLRKLLPNNSSKPHHPYRYRYIAPNALDGQPKNSVHHYNTNTIEGQLNSYNKPSSIGQPSLQQQIETNSSSNLMMLMPPPPHHEDPLIGSSSNSVIDGVVNQVCITFDHVDEAIAQAKQDIEFQMPDDLDDTDVSDATINLIGELNQVVTELLADRFDLSADEILNGLPMIDIKQTDMWNLCPTMARQIDCMPNSRYRSITGHCNNLNYPTMGAANTPFVRYVPADYADGVGEPRVSIVDFSELPSARTVVSMVHQDHDQPSTELSLLIMSWGQLIDHDLALATPPSESSGHNLKCCPNNDHSLCLPIRVAQDDPKYAPHNIRCLEFKRSLAGVRPNCVLGPRAQLNAITSNIDANFIYGTNVEDARALRMFRGGQLRTWNFFADEGLKPLLPPQQRDPDVDCVNRPSDLFCFIAGDVRVNEQTQLTALHIMHVREHNRIASILESLNGHWSDERIYQETRHIMAAIIQHILISEYLPALLGPDVCAQYNLTESVAHWDHYDPNVDIGISNSFSTAAFRQGHTFVQGIVRRYNNRHQLVATHQLRNLFRQPWPLFRPGVVDEFVLGLVDTPAQSFDPFLAEDISGHLFQRPGSPVGFDLPSINIQRAREQGVPGYNTFREWCGLPRAYSFLDLAPYISNYTAYQYSLLYRHVDDIDLFSGGLSEQRLPGAQVGPTFACIIARQFSNLRRGDRFWFENSMMPSSFTPEQLIEIKKTSLARILCSNSDSILDIQRSAFHLPHPVFNERLPCVVLPDIDFRYWQEAPVQSSPLA